MISLVFTMCISYKGIMNNLDSSQQTAFVTRYQTADGYIAVIGVLCPEHLLCTCQKAFSQLEQYNLGASADCVMIDACLSRLLRLCAPPWVRFLGASIYVPHAAEPCGGVAGDLTFDEESATGTFTIFDSNIFGFAFPGAGAMILIGPERDARILFQQMKQELANQPVTRQKILHFLNTAIVFPGQILFVTDGSGGSAGCVFARGADAHSSLEWVTPFTDAEYGDMYGR